MFIYTLGELSKIHGLVIYTKREYGGPVISFNVRGMSSAEAGNILRTNTTYACAADCTARRSSTSITGR